MAPYPPQMERAFDMAQEVEALFTNFDSSVYTIIFIPADADGVLPPGAEKYLKQVIVSRNSSSSDAQINPTRLANKHVVGHRYCLHQAV